MRMPKKKLSSNSKPKMKEEKSKRRRESSDKKLKMRSESKEFWLTNRKKLAKEKHWKTKKLFDKENRKSKRNRVRLKKQKRLYMMVVRLSAEIQPVICRALVLDHTREQVRYPRISRKKNRKNKSNLQSR